eukprot:5436312-Lingulodinium_polyedra.AAC.2
MLFTPPWMKRGLSLFTVINILRCHGSFWGPAQPNMQAWSCLRAYELTKPGRGQRPGRLQKSI